MEHEKYNNDFEHFLKEQIDDFIMIPQPKVWYGIYNHLHPDKKWPSITICFLILLAILHIGVANNNAVNKNVLEANQNAFAQNTNKASQQKAPYTASIKTTENSATLEDVALLNNHQIAKTANTNFTQQGSNNKFVSVQAKSNFIVENKDTKPLSESYSNMVLENDYAILNKPKKIKEANTNKFIINDNQLEQFNTIGINKKLVENETALVAKNTKADLLNSFKNSLSLTKDLNRKNKTITNAQAQIKLPLKQSKHTITYYVTPSVGYRNLTQTRANKSLYSSSNLIYDPNSVNSGALVENLTDETALNLEIGATYNRKVNKKIIAKVGLQANYTNYVSRVSAIDHPIQNALAVGTQATNFGSMEYDAKAGGVTLNKSTVQIAIPIGVDYKILKYKNITWYAGATLQPSYVIGGSGYVLSADASHYAVEKSLLRKLNINTAIETFASIKTANGIYLNVGPQFRYQLLSTYKNTYNFKENLYSLGLKVGVTRAF
jgi:hypothetical protein